MCAEVCGLPFSTLESLEPLKLESLKWLYLSHLIINPIDENALKEPKNMCIKTRCIERKETRMIVTSYALIRQEMRFWKRLKVFEAHFFIPREWREIIVIISIIQIDREVRERTQSGIQRDEGEKSGQQRAVMMKRRIECDIAWRIEINELLDHCIMGTCSFMVRDVTLILKGPLDWFRVQQKRQWHLF